MFQGDLGIIAQMALDALLILAIVVFILKGKAKKSVSSNEESEALMASLENFLKESKEISQGFAENLDEKKKSIKSLISQLDDKVKEINLYLRSLEVHLRDVKSDFRGPGDDDPDLKDEIIMLAEQNLSTNEIAQRVGRPKDEVELTLDLKKGSL